MKLKLSLWILGILTLYGCHIGDLEFDKIKLPTYSPSAAFIIGSAKYTIKELVEDIEDERLEVKESDELLLSFIYTDSASFENSEEFISFKDIENTAVVEPGIASPVSTVEVTIPVRQVFEFEYPSEDDDLVDSLFYSSGSLELSISSTFQASGTYTIQIPGTRDIDTNEDFTYSGSLDYRGSIPVRDQTQVSLLGFKTILDNGSGENVFQLIFDGELVVPVGSSVSIADFVDIDLGIRNPNFSAIYGDFGTDTSELQNQSIELNGFEDFGELGLEIFAPVISLEVNNSYGLPLAISLDGFQAVNNDETIISLTGDIVDNPTIINSPVIAGESAFTVFEIGKDNSNISELLSSTPIRLEIPINGTANPPGSNALNNFLTDSSDVSLKAIIEIPLELKMDGFTRTFDFDISDFDIDDANAITVRVNSSNELPFTGSMDIRFIDVNDEVLYEVPNQNVLVSPSIGNDGRTVGAATNQADIVLDAQGIAAFVTADRVDVTINIDSFDNANGTFVKIFSDYELEMELAFFGEFIIEL